MNVNNFVLIRINLFYIDFELIKFSNKFDIIIII